jgi:hydroxyacylglutathione hydrolase
MKLTQVRGNTWYLEGEELIPLYRLAEGRCILLDTGHPDERQALFEALEKYQLTPVGILCSHMHIDHHGNTHALRSRYRIPAALPLGEAEACRTALALKAHLGVFTLPFVEETPILSCLVGPVERQIDLEEDRVEWCGVEFEIIHTPGHSHDHICVTTPDEVCYVGDLLLSWEELKGAKVPFALDVVQDLRSKRAQLGRKGAKTYLMAHRGVVEGSVDALLQANIEVMEDRLTALAGLVTRPMSQGEFYQAAYYDLGMRTSHPIKAAHQERFLRPYLECLVARGVLKTSARDGMVYYSRGNEDER